MRPPLRQPPVARPVELPAGPARPGAHAARLAHWSAAPQSAVATEHSGRFSLSCPSGVVLLLVVFERPTVGGYATSLLQRAGDAMIGSATTGSRLKRRIGRLLNVAAVCTRAR